MAAGHEQRRRPTYAPLDGSGFGATPARENLTPGGREVTVRIGGKPFLSREYRPGEQVSLRDTFTANPSARVFIQAGRVERDDEMRVDSSSIQVARSRYKTQITVYRTYRGEKLYEIKPEGEGFVGEDRSVLNVSQYGSDYRTSSDRANKSDISDDVLTVGEKPSWTEKPVDSLVVVERELAEEEVGQYQVATSNVVALATSNAGEISDYLDSLHYSIRIEDDANRAGYYRWAD